MHYGERQYNRKITSPSPKYELLRDDSISEGEETLYRIRALRDFGPVKHGDLGGYIAGEHNLSHRGECWVWTDARVCGKARVSGDAQIGGHAVASRKSEVGVSS